MRLVVTRLLVGVLGIIFLVAGVAKAMDITSFALEIKKLELDIFFPAKLIAYLAIAIEVFIGILLIFQNTHIAILTITSLLILFFLYITGYLYWLSLQGVEVNSCGCFGNLIQRTPKEAFLQDLLLLLPPVIVAWFFADKKRKISTYSLITAFCITLAVTGLAFSKERFPKVGKKVEEVCVRENVCIVDVVPEIIDYSGVVIFASRDKRWEDVLSFVDSTENAILLIPENNQSTFLGMGVGTPTYPVPEDFFLLFTLEPPFALYLKEGKIIKVASM